MITNNNSSNTAENTTKKQSNSSNIIRDKTNKTTIITKYKTKYITKNQQ
jgi:hypothetical protein